MAHKSAVHAFASALIFFNFFRKSQTWSYVQCLTVFCLGYIKIKSMRHEYDAFLSAVKIKVTHHKITLKLLGLCMVYSHSFKGKPIFSYFYWGRQFQIPCGAPESNKAGSATRYSLYIHEKKRAWRNELSATRCSVEHSPAIQVKE